MAVTGLLGRNGQFMGQLLDLRMRRQEVISANVANADTPGYKARVLEFEQELALALPQEGEMTMARTDRQHLPFAALPLTEGEIQEVETPLPKRDGNSVELEQEMAKLSANQILYNYAVQSLGGQVSKLRTVIESLS